MMRAAFAAAILLAPAILSAEDGIDRLVSRYADATAAVQDMSGAAKYRATIRPDGSWPDIDYSSQLRSKWTTATKHLKVRLHALASDWYRNRNRASLDAAHLALRFWLSRRFTNPNWWWNVIGVPMCIGDAALMIYHNIDCNMQGTVSAGIVRECVCGYQNHEQRHKAQPGRHKGRAAQPLQSTFDLMGRVVEPTAKGQLYIHEGRKFIVR